MKLFIMILAMVAHIEFESNSRRQGFEINRIAKCKVERSWERLTDVAEIVLPLNMKLPNLQNGQPSDIKSWIRRGDKVRIKLGYNTTYYDEFSGFVTDIESTTPVKIKCEDLMWPLKQVPAKYSSKRTNIKHLLDKIIPKNLGIKIDAADATIGAFKTKRGESVSMVLSRLRQMGLYTYFKGSTLVCGKVYTDDSERVEYDFSQNIIDNRLKFQFADDIILKVVATSTLSNGDKIEVSVGDDAGHEYRLSYFNITSESELKKLAQQDLDRLKVDGYSGSFQTFGMPFVDHGYKCELTDKNYPERSGTYYVSQVSTTFTESGFRRFIKIDRQITNVI